MTERVEKLIKALHEKNLTKEEAFSLKFAMDDIVHNFCREDIKYKEFEDKKRIQDAMYIDEEGQECMAF